MLIYRNFGILTESLFISNNIFFLILFFISDEFDIFRNIVFFNNPPTIK